MEAWRWSYNSFSEMCLCWRFESWLQIMPLCVLGKNFRGCPSEDVFRYMKRAGKTFNCTWLFIHLLFNQRTVSLGDNSSSVITLLIANIILTILIPQNYIDFYGWEKSMCTRKLLLNLIQTNKNNKWYIYIPDHKWKAWARSGHMKDACLFLA